MLSSSRVAVAGTAFIEPCLPCFAREPPRGRDWLHEIKFDGYRALIHRDGNGARLFIRRGYDWTHHFPAIVSAANAVRAKSFLIDGEAVWCDENGLPVFNRLRQRQAIEAALEAEIRDFVERDSPNLRRDGHSTLAGNSVVMLVQRMGGTSVQEI